METSLITIKNLINEALCYVTLRQLRWQGKVCCPHCESESIIKRGYTDDQQICCRYGCKACGKRFDDLTGTVLSGHHQPLSTWILCLYFMGLNLSNAQIAKELDVNKDDLQFMTEHLRCGIATKKTQTTLSGVVECDEMYLVAGHKGQPEKVKAAGREPRCRRLKGARGRGTLATEKPPIFGMIQRSGEVVIRMLDNVKQDTIKPLILETISPGTLINTDEYNIYSRLEQWGYQHKTVNHSLGEYARDEDGDGFHEVHVNTMEGFWSLLRSWLRPHRGISQAKLPLYLSFFEFVHNVRKRGKSLLASLLSVLVQKTPEYI